MRTVRAMGRKNTRPWGRAPGVLQPASDSRSASWLGPIPRQSRLFSLKGVCLWTSTCVRKQKRGRHNKIKKKKKKRLGLRLLLSDCLLVSSTQVKSWEVAAQGIFSSHLRPHASILGALFCSLNDGVPVEVVLDVVGRQHAPHLEVSQRQPVLLLLLAQLAEVAYGWRRSTLLSVFRTWPHSHLNSHSCPDATNITFLTKVWTDKNYFYYTFRTRLLSDVFLKVFLDAISCVWAILSYFTRDCNALDVTNRWSRLISQEMKKKEKI